MFVERINSAGSSSTSRKIIITIFFAFHDETTSPSDVRHRLVEIAAHVACVRGLSSRTNSLCKYTYVYAHVRVCVCE